MITGVVYGIAGFWTGHFRKDLVPAAGERGWRAYWLAFRGGRAGDSGARADGARSYNVVQRTVYLGVIFVLFPLVIWTGLALSPGFNAALPFFVDVLGGRQSARTLHFFVSDLLVVFLVVHITMIALAGFWGRMREMITGGVGADVVVGKERG